MLHTKVECTVSAKFDTLDYRQITLTCETGGMTKVKIGFDTVEVDTEELYNAIMRCKECNGSQ